MSTLPTPAVGITLQPDRQYLDVLGGVLRDEVDYYEVAPETTWFLDRRGRLVPNGYHRAFLELGEDTGKPFVAHGVGLSLGTADASDARRRRRWLARMALDQGVFRYRWYTDHLGMSSASGLVLGLPVALPMTDRAAATVRRRLRSMQRVVPRVGLETTAQHFVLGSALAEPSFLATALSGSAAHLVLDLHNVVVMADNLGFDPREYLDGLFACSLGPRVIEIHVSGGSASDPDWLPSRRVLRLDSHDASVPALVWSLLDEVLPRCPRLRGVTLERMEGTVGSDDVPVIRDELRRIRASIAQSAPKPRRFSARRTVARGRSIVWPRLDAASYAWLEATIARVLVARDPLRELDRVRADRHAPIAALRLLDDVDPDGVAMSALLVARLRFERVTNGSSAALRAFDDDPVGLTETFRRYHHTVAPTFFSVQEEGRAFDAFTTGVS